MEKVVRGRRGQGIGYREERVVDSGEGRGISAETCREGTRQARLLRGAPRQGACGRSQVSGAAMAAWRATAVDAAAAVVGAERHEAAQLDVGRRHRLEALVAASRDSGISLSLPVFASVLSRSLALSPSLPPSLPPSLSPSLPPSLPPSVPPSLPPSLRPSLPPSVPPSLRPSPSPSLRPSLSPSLRPLRHPAPRRRQERAGVRVDTTSRACRLWSAEPALHPPYSVLRILAAPRPCGLPSQLPALSREVNGVYTLRCLYIARITSRDNERYVSHGFCHCARPSLGFSLQRNE